MPPRLGHGPWDMGVLGQWPWHLPKFLFYDPRCVGWALSLARASWQRCVHPLASLPASLPRARLTSPNAHTHVWPLDMHECVVHACPPCAWRSCGSYGVQAHGRILPHEARLRHGTYVSALAHAAHACGPSWSHGCIGPCTQPIMVTWLHWPMHAAHHGHIRIQ